jgi:hypothetical protein
MQLPERKRKTLEINVYDAQGWLVKQQTQRKESTVKVEIQQLKSGLYTIRFTDGRTSDIKKFLKQ